MMFESAAKTLKAVFDWRAVLAAVVDPRLPLRHRALVHAGFELQARPSELWALVWGDFDLTSGTVVLAKAVRRKADGLRVTSGSKTGAKGNRCVPFSPHLAATLAALKAERGAADDDYVFLSGTGLPLHGRDRVDHAWQAARKALGLPAGPGFYSLKHLSNSFARENGASGAALADRMGHQSERMGGTVYRVPLGLEPPGSSPSTPTPLPRRLRDA
jgi:integrase